VPDLASQLANAVTTFDRKQSTKRGYNRYALGQYLQRVDEIVADVAAGATPRQAVMVAFSGRLRDAALRGIGEPKATAEEDAAAERGAWYYVPASER
jgi:hypothetical protein